LANLQLEHLGQEVTKRGERENPITLAPTDRPVWDGVTLQLAEAVQFRHFLRWLNKSPEFTWRRPADLGFGQARIPLNPSEKGRAARAAQVETYTLTSCGQRGSMPSLSGDC
jgi:hypothetical protein